MKTTTLKLYSFQNEIACYYYKAINEVLMFGIKDRNSMSFKSDLVGFWKIKQLKQ
jgi:uncharacterized protein YdeI (YjbR/CyaY-like superfamily)